MKPITKETIDKLSILHDKIKNHPFRKSFEKELLEDYYNLYYVNLFGLIGMTVYDTYELSREGIYLYYRSVKDRWLHYKSSKYKDGYWHYRDSAEIWSNPNIALINSAHHNLNSIKWSLKSNWDNSIYKKKYLTKFIETTEKILTILHALVEGVEITEMDFPKEYRDGEIHYKFVKNPLYDNDWTLEKYLYKEWWDDKGYTDGDGTEKYINEFKK